MSSSSSDALCMQARNVALELPNDYKSALQRMTERFIRPARPNAQDPYYDLAQHLCHFGGFSCVIDIGCGDPESLTQRFSPERLAVIGDQRVLARASKKVPKNRLFLQNFSQLLALPESLLRQSVVICSDLIHRLDDPLPLVESLCAIAQIAPFVIVGTPDRDRRDGPFDNGPPRSSAAVRHWKMQEALELLRRHGGEVPFCGYVGACGLAKPRDQSVFLFGAHCLSTPSPAKSVVALVSCYNDIDIISHCYRHLKEQGVAVAFIDNWSEDGTWQQIQSWREQEPHHCVHVERFPAEGASNHFELSAILRRKADLAQELQFDWILHHDSDEFRESPNPHLTLAEAISRVDALGYTALDHTVIDFRPIDSSFTGRTCPHEHFSHFEFGDRVDLFMQIRAWKRQDTKVELQPLGGHVAFFEGIKVFPLKFLLRHYSIRSPAHAERKFYTHRLPRVEKERKTLGWHHHLESEVSAKAQHKFLWQQKDLYPYAPGVFEHEYVFERLAGLGIHDVHRRQAIQLYSQPLRQGSRA